MKSNRLIDVKSRRAFRLAGSGILMVLIGALAACQTQQQIVTEHEDNLAAAGV